MNISGKVFVVLIFVFAFLFFASSGDEKKAKYMSPIDFEIDNNILYVAGYSSKTIKSIDLNTGKLKALQKLEMAPKAILVSGKKMYTVSSYSEGELIISNLEDLKIESKIKVGHGASDIVISPNEKFAYVANQYSNDISVVDLISKEEINRIPVLRQPKVLEISNDGKYLFVANFLTTGRADADTVTSEISIIDTEKAEVIKKIPLANGVML